jgi:hypothetical protein
MTAAVSLAMQQFEDDLERLVDDLRIAIVDALPDVELDEETRDDLQEIVAEAFDALAWPLKRALRELREALE